MRWGVTLAVWAVALAPIAAHAQAAAVPFVFRWGMSLSESDKAEILEIARALSDRPIMKILAQPALPSSTPFVQVSYVDETIDTWLIVTRLQIRRLDARDFQQWRVGHEA
jgi:hypothetical protein